MTMEKEMTCQSNDKCNRKSGSNIKMFVSTFKDPKVSELKYLVALLKIIFLNNS